MNESKPTDNLDDSCPKSLWIKLTLSDDEALEDSKSLPQGVQLHLSQCVPCRALADRLLSVSAMMQDLGKLEPSGDLVQAADSRILEAVQSGAQLTGRVEVPDDDFGLAQPVKPGRGGYFRFAAAAVILIVVSVMWATYRGDRSERIVTVPLPGASESSTTGSGPDASLRGMPSESTLAARPVEENGVESVATDTEPSEPKRKGRRVCSYQSHIEAALSEDDKCIPRAVVLPDPATRHLGWGAKFDKNPRKESTSPLFGNE